MAVRIKRVYDDAEKADGFRVLVDRLWPRGVKKEAAELDEWLKNVAPSPDLRTWWNHDPERMGEFAKRYRSELDDNDEIDELREIVSKNSTVTLVYAAKDPKINHARILRDYLDD
ncbi:DUF488 domain-containing protein [Paramicrobacterium fandaimingii]|uniref:DUF488 domain-containing protein n=1 Tax=Paramicrobacterium fandaimingii TaxID=2708079 RepID=UPI001420ED02|nr:DUF488 family protein [Microbacterium fandaimingii]